VKRAFRSIRFRPTTLATVERVQAVLAEYDDQRLTARQVYYQFVARGWLANTERSYKTMTSLLVDARYAGIVDWDAIEDRGREPDVPNEWSSISSLVESALRSYRLPRWEQQDCYAELWVEKQALAGMLSPIAHAFHVPLMVNKGYSSASAMKAAADRMIAACRPTKLLYLGDHDPSGEDMVRDIRDRLAEFKVYELDVVKVGLTIEQVRQYKLPPNPAKVTDSRAAKYIEKYGAESWELDALPPRVLNDLARAALAGIVDPDAMNEVIEQEDRDKERLRQAVSAIVEAAP
jgi:hypothetical protein